MRAAGEGQVLRGVAPAHVEAVRAGERGRVPARVGLEYSIGRLTCAFASSLWGSKIGFGR